MKTEQTKQQSLQISQEQFLSFVRTMIGGSRGREDDEHPLPPGPWDPVIRAALERMKPHPEPWKTFDRGVLSQTIASVFGPQPDPWKAAFASILARHPEIFDVVGGGYSFGEEVLLNPQPLPPRFAFLAAAAQTVISRAGLLQEIADAISREGDQHGIIIVGGYIRRFCDDWCGNGFRLKWPFPGPRPHWFAKELDGSDLVVMATQFEQAAKDAFSPDLRQSLRDASTKFVEAGMSKMQ
jgi:hypothetical protein